VTATDRRRVERWVRKWQRRILLQHWTLKVDFSDEPHPDTCDDEHIYAAVWPDSSRTNALMRVYPEMWTLPDDEREKWLLHELIHCPANQLGAMASRAVKRKQAVQRDADDTEEQLVQWVTNALWKAYEG
jgi:hypothetical protein